MKRHERTVSSDSFVERTLQTLQQRRGVYAHPQDQFQAHADMLNAFFSPRGYRFTAEDSAMILILLKMSRLANGTHDDSLLDICGYTECIADLRPDQRNVRKE